MEHKVLYGNNGQPPRAEAYIDQKKQKRAFLKFKSRYGNLYIYDAITNMIFPDIHGFSEIIENYYIMNKDDIILKIGCKYGKDTVLKNFDYIYKLINRFGAFYFKKSDFMGNRIFVSQDNFHNHIVNVRQIVLEVTQACNLRCSYCVYSGRYKDYRTHNEVHMSDEIAIKSIDKYLSLISSDERTAKSGRVFINFYGGEPLLNFQLIKKVVHHVKKLLANGIAIEDRIYFTLTTNGLLLKGDILDYIIENDFLLAISLDGPEAENDKNRILNSQKGSFDAVWKNIDNIFTQHRDYIDSHIVFLSTVHPNHNIIEIDNFFDNLFHDRYNRLKISLEKDGDYKDRINFFKELKNKYFSDESFDNISHFSPFINGFYGPVYRKFYNRYFMGRNGKYTSTCSPDDFRLFVSSLGNFHICERINTNFSIGNYETGIDYDRVKTVFDRYDNVLVNNRCDQCLAKNSCFLCFATAAHGDDFVIDREKCEDQIKLTEASLSDLVSYFEKDEDKILSFLFPGMIEEDDNTLMKAFY